METKVYYASVEPLSDRSVYEKYRSLLPRSRKEKVDRIKFKKDKKLSVGAFALLSYALGTPDIDIAEDENGKPYLAGAPEICFNLSHSGSRVMCAVSDRPVGCDVEEKRPVKIEKIASRFFCPEEYEYIMGLGTEKEKLDVFFRFWTLKESFMKATGLGFRLPPNGFLLPLNEIRSELSTSKKSVSHTVDENEYFLKEYCLNDGYSYSCCSMKDDLPEKIVRVRL